MASAEDLERGISVSTLQRSHYGQVRASISRVVVPHVVPRRWALGRPLPGWFPVDRYRRLARIVSKESSGSDGQPFDS